MPQHAKKHVPCSLGNLVFDRLVGVPRMRGVKHVGSKSTLQKQSTHTNPKHNYLMPTLNLHDTMTLTLHGPQARSNPWPSRWFVQSQAAAAEIISFNVLPAI